MFGYMYAVEICYLSLNHNLVEGEDYEEVNSTLTVMPGGPLITNVTGQIVDDERLEQYNETFSVWLEVVEQPSFGTVNLATTQANVIIQDDDGRFVEFLHV